MRHLASNSASDLPIPFAFTLHEAAAWFSVSPSTVRKWVIDGKLEARLRPANNSSVYRVILLPEMLRFADIRYPREGENPLADRLMAWHRKNGAKGRATRERNRAQRAREKEEGKGTTEKR